MYVSLICEIPPLFSRTTLGWVLVLLVRVFIHKNSIFILDPIYCEREIYHDNITINSIKIFLKSYKNTYLNTFNNYNIK